MVGRWSRGFMGEAISKVGFELAHKIKKGILPNKRFCLSKTLDAKITTTPTYGPQFPLKRIRKLNPKLPIQKPHAKR